MIDIFIGVVHMQALETSRLMTDLYSAKIILSTMGKVMSAQELSDMLEIPIAACYRKIKQLEGAGLLGCVERRLTQSGKRVCYYRSQVKTASIEFSEGRVVACIKKTDGPVENYVYTVASEVDDDMLTAKAPYS